jgi:phosphotransferase system HPr (HPr) family protein
VKTNHVTIQCENGLHARVAAQVVNIAQGHESDVHIQCDGCPRANACSILELLMLGAGKGTRLELIVDGSDEKVVMKKLSEVFDQGGGI